MAEEPMMYQSITPKISHHTGSIPVYGKRVEDGMKVKIHTTTAVNKTSATKTQITVGIWRNHERIPIESWPGPIDANDTKTTECVYWLKEGDQPYAYFEKATENDELLHVANGEQFPLLPEERE